MKKGPHRAGTIVFALVLLVSLWFPTTAAPQGNNHNHNIDRTIVAGEEAWVKKGEEEATSTAAEAQEAMWQRWLQHHPRHSLGGVANVQVHGSTTAANVNADVGASVEPAQHDDHQDDQDDDQDKDEVAVPATASRDRRHRRRLKGEECQQFKVYYRDADLFDNSIRGPDFIKWDVPLYRPPKTTPVGRFVFDLQTVSPVTAASIVRGFLTFGRFNLIAFSGYSEAIPVPITGGAGTYECAGGNLQFGTGPVPNATYYQVKVCLAC